MEVLGNLLVEYTLLEGFLYVLILFKHLKLISQGQNISECSSLITQPIRNVENHVARLTGEFPWERSLECESVILFSVPVS